MVSFDAHSRHTRSHDKFEQDSRTSASNGIVYVLTSKSRLGSSLLILLRNWTRNMTWRLI